MMREGLTLIIALLIVGILLDGLRRVRANRRAALKMKRNVGQDTDGQNDPDEALSSSEFPSGGARVASYRDPKDLEQVNQSLRESYVASRMTRGAPNRIPEQVSLNLDQPKDADSKLKVSEPDRDAELAEAPDPSADSAEDISPPPAEEPVLGDLDNLDAEPESESEEDTVPTADHEPITAELELDHEPTVPQEETEEATMPSFAEPQNKPEAAKHKSFWGAKKDPEPAIEQPQERMPDEVLIINVMAKRDQVFSGPALLDAMVNQHLKFGDMDIFHRHESESGAGKILFSVANIVVPGTFEVGAMEEFETPGISMFLTLPCPGDSISAFNTMASAAQAIAQQLGGDLKDEQRNVMTKQTIEHARQRVLEYERKRRLNK